MNPKATSRRTARHRAKDRLLGEVASRTERGQSAAQIADKLAISERYVRQLRREIREDKSFDWGQFEPWNIRVALEDGDPPEKMAFVQQFFHVPKGLAKWMWAVHCSVPTLTPAQAYFLGWRYWFALMFTDTPDWILVLDAALATQPWNGGQAKFRYDIAVATDNIDPVDPFTESHEEDGNTIEIKFDMESLADTVRVLGELNIQPAHMDAQSWVLPVLGRLEEEGRSTPSFNVINQPGGEQNLS